MRFEHVAQEMGSFWRIAGHRFEPDAVAIWKKLMDDLESYRSFRAKQVLTWSTPPQRPLVTIPNKGQHQMHSGIELFGQVAFTWDLLPQYPSSQKRPAEYFVLHNSSVKLILWQKLHNKKPVQRTAWCFDVGNDESPGCHFHAKFTDPKRDPKTRVDVPRLPTILFMPSDALDFLLGELWRETWATDAAVSEATQWRRWPNARLQKLLDALRSKTGDRGSPWMSLKQYRPPSDLFLERNT
jgi:hypothetical protein